MLGTGQPVMPEQLDENLIIELCREIPIIHASMQLHFQGHIDYTQALILTIKSLSDCLTDLQKVHEDTLKYQAFPRNILYDPKRVHYIPD
jgi:hypothetical protein